MLRMRTETYLWEATLSEKHILFSNNTCIEFVQVCLQLNKSRNSEGFLVTNISTFLSGDQPCQFGV